MYGLLRTVVSPRLWEKRLIFHYIYFQLHYMVKCKALTILLCSTLIQPHKKLHEYQLFLYIVNEPLCIYYEVDRVKPFALCPLWVEATLTVRAELLWNSELISVNLHDASDPVLSLSELFLFLLHLILNPPMSQCFSPLSVFSPFLFGSSFPSFSIYLSLSRLFFSF